MAFEITLADTLAGCALLLSAYATTITLRFNQRQKALIESQEKLNILLLAKEQDDVKNDKKAELGASFIKLGSNKHRLKIWNKGKSPARNIRLVFPEENNVVSQSEIDSKFPLEVLDTFQAVELIARLHWESKNKYKLQLSWDDDYEENNEKFVYPTI